MAQGMWVALEAGKSEEVDSHLGPPDKNAAPSSPDFTYRLVRLKSNSKSWEIEDNTCVFF